MNSLQTVLPESKVLDLFSGSGALAIEALSRGAECAVLVEENKKAVQIIQKNLDVLKLDEIAEVWPIRVEQVLPRVQGWVRDHGAFDLVLMDPPYEQGYELKLLSEWPWQEILSANGRICVESEFRKDGAWDSPAGFEVVRHERYGDSQLTFYRRSET